MTFLWFSFHWELSESVELLIEVWRSSGIWKLVYYQLSLPESLLGCGLHLIWLGFPSQWAVSCLTSRIYLTRMIQINNLFMNSKLPVICLYWEFCVCLNDSSIQFIHAKMTLIPHSCHCSRQTWFNIQIPAFHLAPPHLSDLFNV